MPARSSRVVINTLLTEPSSLPIVSSALVLLPKYSSRARAQRRIVQDQHAIEGLRIALHVRADVSHQRIAHPGGISRRHRHAAKFVSRCVHRESLDQLLARQARLHCAHQDYSALPSTIAT